MRNGDDPALAPDPALANDLVVILARGESRRFGAPKAVARVGDDPRPLVRRVAATYAAALRAPVLVVTLAELAAGVGAALDGVPGVTVLGAPGGGDTARTLGLAAGWMAANLPGCARAWAHPVDVPRVAGRTLAQVARVAMAHPGRVVRPGR